ncbi:tetrapyrrole methylase family protein/MazG family protein [Virgibacillus natechei]|uniref:Tetrapyrrole methylase family protein/MazG family protein n=1 Tax=Virgibacillus natechei TaxID=1216297 RepID=A0ABS4IJ47_9BACI|nr:nucleoside triphosphate pyrophosphohydrolase [Virgibacillus natechei]MBP1970371.1 tetrapyrrole methylase family protein/MazG family protein [Virgibacillus natechei]UZD13195.1 nucleoside triphosphate pyrophosphohydrolase [Virgibacillus natechei]
MSKIEIIGLGAGDMDQLSLGIYKKLTNTNGVIYTRTIDHPVIGSLQQEGVTFEAFDHVYEKEEQFTAVYQTIVDTLIEKAKDASIIYTLPGHPMLAEKTVQLLLEQTEVEVEVAGGQSYLDDLFTALKIDPIDGFQFVDGTSFERSQLDYRHHLLFCQVYDRFIASDVKLTLLEDLPPDYPVTVVEAAGSALEVIQTIPIDELDHSIEVSNVTSVYVPPVPSRMLHHTFTNLRETIATLRGPNGCPWDRVQTHETLREYAIEEVYELIDAIDNEDDENIIEELGDILLQVMLHSQIGEDDGYFNVDDVIGSITNKMIHRHPHVFADTAVDSVDDVYKNWDELKEEEKGEQRKSVLDGIPRQLPSLSKAFKLQKKAAKVGFNWDAISDVWNKLEEELGEVQEAIELDDKMEIEKEFGDVLFVLANLTRYYKINPEIALNQTNKKFLSRFSYIEEQLRIQEKEMTDTTLEEMDALWNQAKKGE